MTERLGLAEMLAAHMRSMRVPVELVGCRQERDFQVWLGGELRERLEREFPGQYEVRTEPAGGGVKPVLSLGTSFWPDVAVYDSESSPLFAVEVKCVTRRNRASHVSQPIGQALLYRELYAESAVVLILVEPPSIDFEVPVRLSTRLLDEGIELIAVHAYLNGSSCHD